MILIIIYKPYMSRIILFLLSLFFLASCASIPSDSGNIIPEDSIIKKNIKVSDIALEPHQLNVALLVPLGKQKDNIGDSLVKAAQLAVMDSNNSTTNLVVLNSELINSNPNLLAKKLEEQNVKLIIGPLYGPETEKLSAFLNKNNITILSLSNDSSLKDDSLLIMGIAPGSQANIITNYAIGAGANHLHLILPDNKFGKLIESETENIVLEKNNVYQHVNWYTQNNVEQVMDQILSSIKNEPNQAIFVPQGGNILNLLNNLLAKHKLNKVILLGLQNWDSPNILELSSLDGAIFLRKNLSEEQFYDNFSRTFGLAANNIDFITYNTLIMAINMYRDQIYINKQSIIENNRNFGKYSNVMFDNNGLSMYKFSIAKIQNREFVPIE